MAGDGTPRMPPSRPWPDDPARWEDDFDVPTWISAPRQDLSDLKEESARNDRQIWFFSIAGLAVAAVAVVLVVRPWLHSALDERLFGARGSRAVHLAAPAPVQVEVRAKPSEPELAAARQRLVEDMPRPNEPSSGGTLTTTAAAAVPVEPPKSVIEPLRPPEPVALPPPAPPAIAPEEVRKMLARAASLIRDGQIGSARALLELAARSRDPQAVFALAETYNPKMLARWRAIGIVGNEVRALSLYQQAAEGGMLEASARLRELGQ